MEFVIDGRNGKIVEPEPEKIAEALDYYAGDKESAIKMGQDSKIHLKEMKISWEKVVKELTR